MVLVLRRVFDAKMLRFQNGKRGTTEKVPENWGEGTNRPPGNRRMTPKGR
jgi:hypothetical protein